MKIIKVPGINGLGKTERCRDSGDKIIEGLDEIRSSESGKIINKDLLNIEEIELDNNNLKDQNKKIYEASLRNFNEEDKVIFLGGDHSISYSLVKGFMDSNKERGREGCLIVFDAHADLMENMKEPTHEEWLRGVIEEGFPVKNILLIGVRNKDQAEIKYIEEKGIREVRVERVNMDIEEVGDYITEFSFGKELYVSVDVDVLDPSFVKATGYKEPGGLSVRELLYLIKRLNRLSNLKGVDIVEIQTNVEGSEESLKIGSKILGEVL